MNESEDSTFHSTNNLPLFLPLPLTWEAVRCDGLQHFEEVDSVLREGLQLLVDHVERALKQCLKHLWYVVNHSPLYGRRRTAHTHDIAKSHQLCMFLSCK